MGFWKKVGYFLTSITEEEKKRKQAIVRSYLIQDSLTCRCRGMAVPVLNTTNKYVCMSCGARFADTHHRLNQNIQRHSDISSITYNKVILQLQNEANESV